jgi:hypothetical protein
MRVFCCCRTCWTCVWGPVLEPSRSLIVWGPVNQEPVSLLRASCGTRLRAVSATVYVYFELLLNPLTLLSSFILIVE